ncbi:MAG TPA: hypothetical protein ENN21_07985, partial [Spirochaetes bacterium]|nr:hypothetical protein [Spirochaetota bacterium]
IRVYDAVRHGQGVSLGIDVGSTSTKVAVVDAASRDVILDVYRKTGGDPVGAARSCFGSITKILGSHTEVVRAAATGSGRTLVGELMGAHLIVNEISAHHYGASHEEPGVETIIEIGGQDAKYIRAANGMVVDSAMNYVCAAGTGSFIEEQANRLGFDVREIGGAVLGRRAPRTSDRCTVFMEQDIHKLLGEGYGREEVMAGVMYSIAKNYLRRVAGSRPIAGDRVFFQGATARNLGLVAAFESLLDREIVVSPFCHIMGAYGAALLALDRPLDEERRFRGLSCFDKEIELEYRRCGDCRNRCLITTARVGGEEVSWGYLCGRDGNSRRAGKRGKNYFIGMDFSQGSDHDPRLRGAPRAVIGIPRALSMFSYLPLWKTFLEEMGFEVADSGASGAGHREQAAGMAVSDFCFPVKLGLAHAAVLADRGGVDAVFFPALVSEKPQENGLPRVFCPYVISYPSLLTGAVGLSIPVIAPSLDFRLDRPLLVRELWNSLKHFGVSEREVAAAFDRALDTLKSLQAKRYGEGKAILEAMARRGKPAVVFIGRPYNLHDRVINLGLPEQFRSYGFDIVPYECLMDPDVNDSGIHHMYWNYGERILAAAEIIREIPFLYPVYFSNFGCGPDSFVLTRFERAMGGKPYLILELDEHGADTGYLTRVEAFIDVINSNKSAPPKESGDGGMFHGKWQKKGRKLWIPPMHEISAILTAAGFRAWDFDAESLPVEDAAALEAGRQGARGGECLPAHTTIGTFLRTMRRIGADPAGQAFFMPTAEGPCRYGQYTLLHRDMLDRAGFHQTAIFSPSSVNSYMGMPESLRMYLWDILIAGDMVMKALCRVRPYETVPGEADRAAAAAIRGLEGRIERRAKLVPAAAEAVREIMAVPVSGAPRPLVGIVGEIYVRCNPFCNNNLIRSIEEQGGEAWLTPISEWILYTSWCERYFSHLYRRGLVHNFLLDLKTRYIFSRMKKFEKALAPLLADRYEPTVERVMELGGAYLPVIFEGEAILTVGRALAFAEQGAALVVNCAPFGCMPGNITNAFMNTVGEKSGVPMVTLFYDGVSDINRIVGIYLNNRDTGESPIIHHAARNAVTIAGKVSS